MKEQGRTSTLHPSIYTGPIGASYLLLPPLLRCRMCSRTPPVSQSWVEHPCSPPAPFFHLRLAALFAPPRQVRSLAVARELAIRAAHHVVSGALLY